MKDLKPAGPDNVPNDASSAVPPASPSLRPLGKAAAIVAFLGCGCCVLTLIWVFSIGASYEPIGPGPGSPDASAAQGLNVLGKGLNILGQVFVFVVGGLVGTTLSLVGLVLCAVDLPKGPHRLVLIGLAAGLAGPLSIGLTLVVIFNQ